jgi:hypothetical protein
MKIGREAEEDPSRVAAARKASEQNVNYLSTPTAPIRENRDLKWRSEFAISRYHGSRSPLLPAILDGLNLTRDRSAAGMDMAAGEGYDYFDRMLAAGAVDVLLADATPCAGVIGFLRVAALCDARSLTLWTHCGSSMQAHPFCATRPICHIDYFQITYRKNAIRRSTELHQRLSQTRPLTAAQRA